MGVSESRALTTQFKQRIKNTITEIIVMTSPAFALLDYNALVSDQQNNQQQFLVDQQQFMNNNLQQHDNTHQQQLLLLTHEQLATLAAYFYKAKFTSELEFKQFLQVFGSVPFALSTPGYWLPWTMNLSIEFPTLVTDFLNYYCKFFYHLQDHDDKTSISSSSNSSVFAQTSIIVLLDHLVKTVPQVLSRRIVVEFGSDSNSNKKMRFFDFFQHFFIHNLLDLNLLKQNVNKQETIDKAVEQKQQLKQSIDILKDHQLEQQLVQQEQSTSSSSGSKNTSSIIPRSKLQWSTNSNGNTSNRMQVIVGSFTSRLDTYEQVIRTSDKFTSLLKSLLNNYKKYFQHQEQEHQQLNGNNSIGNDSSIDNYSSAVVFRPWIYLLTGITNMNTMSIFDKVKLSLKELNDLKQQPELDSGIRNTSINKINMELQAFSTQLKQQQRMVLRNYEILKLLLEHENFESVLRSDSNDNSNDKIDHQLLIDAFTMISFLSSSANTSNGNSLDNLMERDFWNCKFKDGTMTDDMVYSILVNPYHCNASSNTNMTLLFKPEPVFELCLNTVSERYPMVIKRIVEELCSINSNGNSNSSSGKPSYGFSSSMALCKYWLIVSEIISNSKDNQVDCSNTTTMDLLYKLFNTEEYTVINVKPQRGSSQVCFFYLVKTVLKIIPYIISNPRDSSNDNSNSNDSNFSILWYCYSELMKLIPLHTRLDDYHTNVKFNGSGNSVLHGMISIKELVIKHHSTNNNKYSLLPCLFSNTTTNNNDNISNNNSSNNNMGSDYYQQQQQLLFKTYSQIKSKDKRFYSNLKYLLIDSITNSNTTSDRHTLIDLFIEESQLILRYISTKQHFIKLFKQKRRQMKNEQSNGSRSSNNDNNKSNSKSKSGGDSSDISNTVISHLLELINDNSNDNSQLHLLDMDDCTTLLNERFDTIYFNYELANNKLASNLLLDSNNNKVTKRNNFIDFVFTIDAIINNIANCGELLDYCGDQVDLSNNNEQLQYFNSKGKQLMDISFRCVTMALKIEFNINTSTSDDLVDQNDAEDENEDSCNSLKLDYDDFKKFFPKSKNFEKFWLNNVHADEFLYLLGMLTTPIHKRKQQNQSKKLTTIYQQNSNHQLEVDKLEFATQLMSKIILKLPHEVARPHIAQFYENVMSETPFTETLENLGCLYWHFASELAPMFKYQIVEKLRGELFSGMELPVESTQGDDEDEDQGNSSGKISKEEMLLQSSNNINSDDNDIFVLAIVLTYRICGDQFQSLVKNSFSILISVILPSLVEDLDEVVTDNKLMPILSALMEFCLEVVVHNPAVRKVAIEKLETFVMLLAYPQWQTLFESMYRGIPELLLVLKRSLKSDSQWRMQVLKHEATRMQVAKLLARLPIFAVEWQRTNLYQSDVVIVTQF